MKKFLGIPFLNVNTSAKAWLDIKDLAEYLEVGVNVLKSRVLFSDAAPFRAIRPRVDDLEQLKDLPTFASRPGMFFDLDFALAACFSMSHEPARKMRDQVIYILNNLFYDGFVSLKNYNLDLETRRALTAYVCGVDHYLDIVKDRWDMYDQCRGTSLAPIEITVEKLCVPDFYLHRSEITRVKALDLAIHLFLTHCYVAEDTYDSALAELLGIMGISRDAGIASEDQEAELREWVIEHHNSKLKTIGDTDEES